MTLALRIRVIHERNVILSMEMSFFGSCPLIAQSSGRFKTAHRGFHLSAKAYWAVRRFVTALYGALW